MGHRNLTDTHHNVGGGRRKEGQGVGLLAHFILHTSQVLKAGQWMCSLQEPGTKGFPRTHVASLYSLTCIVLWSPLSSFGAWSGCWHPTLRWPWRHFPGQTLPLGHQCTWPAWCLSGTSLGRSWYMGRGWQWWGWWLQLGAVRLSPPVAPHIMFSGSWCASQGTVWHCGISSKAKQGSLPLAQTLPKAEGNYACKFVNDVDVTFALGEACCSGFLQRYCPASSTHEVYWIKWANNPASPHAHF